MLAGKQEQGWSGDHGLEKKRNSEGNLRFHDKEVRKQIWALGKTCNRNRGRKKILTAGETTKNLRDKDEPKLTNLGEKRMNSTKLHSLLRDAGREMTLGGFGLQRWGARRRIKEKGKLGGDF